MTSFKFARFALPALTAAIVGLGAQAALAQTTAAPSQMMPQGSMSQGSMMAAPAPATAPAATTTAKKHHHMAANALPASEKFSSAATAQAHCPGDVVVWVNTSHSHVFHAASSKYFGKTKHGIYACEKSAVSAGLHASKS